MAFREINMAFSEPHISVPGAPVSCVAAFVRKAGLSEQHAVMAAGLAGGIGLSGGACGALGAAIWIIGMNTIRDGKKMKFKDPRALEVIDKFLKCSDYEFECSEIVGRKFANIEDHAEYLKEGGCADLIDLLAAACA